MSKIILSKSFISNYVKLALNEDLYPSGDITSNLIKERVIKKFKIIANQDGEQVSKQPGFEFQKKWVLNEISIGANSHSERRRTFNGSFAIVRVYDKALTEAQINENIESAFDVEPVGKLSTTWSSIKEQY